MRLLPCLSQNVSVVFEEKDAVRHKLKRNFKDKLRSNTFERRSISTQRAVASVPLQSYAELNENVLPSVSENEFVYLRDGANDYERLDTRVKSVNVGSSSSSFVSKPGPLTLLPSVLNYTESTIIDTTNAFYNNSDYLPSFEVYSPLKENEETGTETINCSARYDPAWGLSQRVVDYSLGSDSDSDASYHKTCHIDGSAGTSSPVSSDVESQTSNEISCSNSDRNNENFKSINYFNHDFIRNNDSIPLRTQGNIVINAAPELTNMCKNRLSGPQVHIPVSDTRCPVMHEQYNPYSSARNGLVKNMRTSPDLYDFVDECDEDTEIDIETVSQSSSASEFLGCMSFGLSHLRKKDLDGWYYLLTEEAGRKKHLQSHTKPTKPVLTARSSQNIPPVNRVVDSQERVVIDIARGKNGFGFSFVDEFPPKVGRVDRASPAEHAGVKKGDMVIRINGQNVSRSTCEGVAHLVKKINPSKLRLELLRDHTISTTTEITATSTHHTHQSSSYNKRGVGTSTDNLYESVVDKQCSDHHKENRVYFNGSLEDDYLTDDDVTASRNSLPNHQRITSTPRLFVGPGHKAVNAPTPCSLIKHESIHRLMSLELDYIDYMHYGIERYSRPLRHSILSANQHMVIFQNVEKLVTISEYHIKQMQENNSSVNSDTDDSQSSETSMFPNSVALIYHSKIHMLSQAYEAYASGLSKSNTLLREMRRNQDFMHFVKEHDFTDKQCADHPSVSAFINRPVLHIQEMYSVLSEVFSATPIHSPDFANLQQIVIKLSKCISSINGLSTAGRVESLDSLTSSQGKTSSGKGSMASLSPTCSSSEADVRHPLFLGSAASLRSIDKDMRRIYETLVFGPDVQAFQLLQEGRHLIYRGEIYRHSNGLWSKSQLLLFSDILLMVNEEPDGCLCVTNNPISIQNLAGIEVNRKYASEFALYLHVSTSATLPRRQRSSTCSSGEKIKIVMRAPSAQEKFMWKSLLEQRVSAFSGSKLQHYGSMRDISHVKTSIIL